MIRRLGLNSEASAKLSLRTVEQKVTEITKRLTRVLILEILFCCFFARPGFALIWYTEDAVITNTISDDIRVGNYSVGQAPTVTLTNGGVLNGGIFVDFGILNIAGGQINTTVPHLFQNYDRVNISSGNISSASVLQNYYIANMSGGTIDGEFRGELSAPQVITMTGGYAHLVNVKAGVASIRGTVDNINTSGSGQVKLEIGGAMLQQLLMINTSTNHIHGGLEMGDLIVGQGAAKCFLYGTNWTDADCHERRCSGRLL